MWWCDNCGYPLKGPICGAKWRSQGKTVRCQDKLPAGARWGAERIPPLDGWLFINDDGSGVPRYELMLKRQYAPIGYTPKSVRGPRPQGWLKALELIADRAAAVIADGVSIPEC